MALKRLPGASPGKGPLLGDRQDGLEQASFSHRGTRWVEEENGRAGVNNTRAAGSFGGKVGVNS